MRRAAGISSWTTFACQFRTDGRHAGDIAARLGEARDEPRLDRIAHQCHHDRDLMRCLSSGEGCRREPGHNQVHFEPHQFLSQSRKPACIPCVRSKFVSNVSSFDVAKLAHILLKEPPKALRGRRSDNQNADGRHFRLLRGGGE
jgi:hypothetical protein